MKRHTATLSLLACAMTTGITLGTAGTASAADGYAPYAQAAALIDRDGSIVKSQGVESVHKAGTGFYCVELDHRIDATTTFPQATLDDGANFRSEIYINRDSSRCGDPTHYILVRTATNGSNSDQPFILTVP